jgi:glycosyltransferase involved in cell wall biosynthesis
MIKFDFQKLRRLTQFSKHLFFTRYHRWILLKKIQKSISHSNGALIIAFPIITWDFRWQRPQHFLTGLRDAGSSILYLAISLMPIKKRLNSTKEAGKKNVFNSLDKNINQVWLSSFNKINIYKDLIEDDDLHNLVMCLGSVIEATKPLKLTYMIQFPTWAPVAFKLKEKYGGNILFDCMDDHAGFSTTSEDVISTEKNLIKTADLVIASSDLIYERVSKAARQSIHIKNGTEFNLFNRGISNGALHQFTDRPIIGYYGAISDWFDADLIAYCAHERPDWSFILIGSTFGANIEPLLKLNNIYLLGEIPYKDLPGYLVDFDVCTIPFKITPLTLATNPVKFYEYISAGKPVVSINLPELAPYAHDCYLADSSAQFLAQLEVALDQKKDQRLIARRVNLAKDNDWGSRVNQLIGCGIFGKIN